MIHNLAILRRLNSLPIYFIGAAALILLTGGAPSPLLGERQGFPTPQAATASPQQPEMTDPLGRSTPRGTIKGFIRAVDKGDYVTAAKYMQVNEKKGKNGKNNTANAETMARQLKEFMDRYFHQPLEAISNSPTGALDDGLPPDRERVGPLTMGSDKVDILLVRVENPTFGLIWLISSETLQKLPALYGAMEKPWIEKVMPDSLLNRRWFGISAAQLIVWAGSIGIPLLFFWLFLRLINLLTKTTIKDPSRRSRAELWYRATHWPTILALTLGFHLAAVRLLGLSLKLRIDYMHFGAVLAVIFLAWLLQRLSTLFFAGLRLSLKRRGRTGAESLTRLAEHLFKVFLVLLAIFLILAVMGVDTKTALAGLGIGGLAIAFGAQKSFENLFGGIFLLTDQTLAIGDLCSIANRLGTVEDVTLRSVRLRTQEQTLLSIPAGAVAQANIENLTTRRKILIQTTLQLRYSTTVNQIRSIIDRIAKLLAENPQIETQTARIRLVNFGERAIELELFAYVLMSDNMRFLAVREDLLLNIATIVESEGSGFAMPSQFIYIEGAASSDTSPRKHVTSKQTLQ